MMKTKWKLAVMMLTLVLVLTSFGMVYAPPPPAPSQPDLSDLVMDIWEYITGDLTDTVDDVADNVDDLADKVDRVSNELGSEAGVWYSQDDGIENIITAYTFDIVRFTVTVTFHQGGPNDVAAIYYNSYGPFWEELKFFDPAADGLDETTFYATVAAKAILISADNDNPVAGADPTMSSLAWSISAVGSGDADDLTFLYPT